MDQRTNPFSPGAGTQPPELAGRDSILEQANIALARIRAGRSSKSLILVGLRGVGKTVLLNRICERAKVEGYREVLIEAHENKSLPALLIPSLRQVLFSLDAMENVSDKSKRGLRVLRSFVTGLKVKIGEVELGIGEAERGAADSGDLEADLGELFLAVAEAAADRQTAVAICVDELQYLTEPELSALIMAMHRVAQRNLPLTLVGAGLPQIIALTGKSKSYAERLFDFPEVGPLSPDDARNALQTPVRKEGVEFSDDALNLIIRKTERYPYFLQQWGFEAWNIADNSPITLRVIKAATKSAITNLDRSFFRVRFDRLTPREKEYLRVLATLGAGNQRSGEIAEQLGVKVQSVAPLRSGLIKKGMIYSPSHGDTAFTVPLFDAFMLRMMPERS
jgi:DNA-binding CsgD family transcriptional regulator/GTPase SAR1 family protein